MGPAWLVGTPHSCQSARDPSPPLAAAQDDVKLVFSKFHRQIPSIKGVLAFMSRQGMLEFSRKTFV
jgi:hypothetical protein